MRAMLGIADRVASHDVSVLILGESGSGKDYLARAIHACSSRRNGVMITIDCAAIPPDLFESEIFGHERGTFTDAQTSKPGKLETAQGGTLYFDEISSLGAPLQAKLLRVLQDRSFSRVGGMRLRDLDVRVISSSSSDLSGVRHDLLYRINVVTLNIPPLRDRAEDIPRLARAFLREAAPTITGIEDEAMRMLLDHPWPGNVRELRNVVERAALIETGSRLAPESLPLGEGFGDAPILAETALRRLWTLAELESRYIREVLRRTRHNYSEAARILGINRKTLLEKRRRYGIED